MGYITFVDLAHNISAFILSILSIYYCINVLFRKNLLKKSVTLSPTITVYFGLVLIFAFSWIFYFGYIIICWRPENTEYNAFVLYFSGLIPALSFNTSSIAETFLCIERCISLLFPLKYSRNLKICFAILLFFGILGSFGGVIALNRYFETMPKIPTTSCQTFNCVAGAYTFKSLFSVRIGLDIVNIIFALILAYLIKKTIVNSANAAQMNKTVFILLISTTFIELIPFISAQIFVMITNEQLFSYIGSFGSTAIIFNTFLSVRLYYKAFKKFNNKHSSNVKILTTIATSTQVTVLK